LTLFFGYADPRPVGTCASCSVKFSISVPWQRFCSDRCNDRWQRFYGQKSRSRKLRRMFFPYLGTVIEDDLKVVMVDGKLRVKAAVRLQQLMKPAKRRGRPPKKELAF